MRRKMVLSSENLNYLFIVSGQNSPKLKNVPRQKSPRQNSPLKADKIVSDKIAPNKY